MVRLLLVLLLLLPELPSTPTALEIRVERGLVTVRARGVPLAEVLERLCLQTGAELVYEGPQPSPLVSASLKDVPEAEVPTRLLEGLGLNYAVQMDARGHRVKTLIIGEAFGSGPTARTSRPSTAGGFRRPIRPFKPEGPVDNNQSGSPNEPPGTNSGAPFTPPGSLARPPEFPANASSPIRPSPLMPYPVFPGNPSLPRPGPGRSPF